MLIDPKYHSTVTKIIKLLEETNCWFEVFEHEPVRTSEEAAKIREGYTQHQGAKAIIVRVKISTSNKKLAMLVFPGDLRFAVEKVKQLLNAKDIRFATEEEVSAITNGVQPGGVPPFGNLFNIEMYVDEKLFENQKIIFNAGDRSFSIGMLAKEYKRILNPNIVDIT